jgi:hypothetical protein
VGEDLECGGETHLHANFLSYGVYEAEGVGVSGLFERVATQFGTRIFALLQTYG